MAKHFIIGGGSGFIGSELTERLRDRGDLVTWISRYPGDNRISWEEVAENGLPPCDAVINLAGQHILNPRRRWNDDYRNEVINSRIETTETLVNAINAMQTPPEVFMSTAGKCFYGTKELTDDENPQEVDEYSEPIGMDFPAELVSQWEAAANGIDKERIRHLRLRIGVVLGQIKRKSYLGKLWRIGDARGFLPIIRLPFCLGVGAVIGKGTQMFPWIHVDDMTGIMLFLLDNPETEGLYNAVSPGIVNNREFTESFSRHLSRPVVWSIPEWLVKRVIGAERSSIMLKGQLVRSRRTIEAGYSFEYDTIDKAMADLVKITF